MRWLDGITDAKDMSFSKHELGHTPGDGEGQEDLACCSPQGHKESDMTGRVNSNMPQLKAGMPQLRPGVAKTRKKATCLCSLHKDKYLRKLEMKHMEFYSLLSLTALNWNRNETHFSCSTL